MITPAVLRAKTAGFCMGVDLALRRLDKTLHEAAGQGEGLLTLGPIIHNPQVLERYAALGVRQISRPDQVPDGSRVVIRAHGVPRDIHDRLERRGVDVVDATCPKVKTAQRLIARQTSRGRRMFLFGERDHPEVIGLLSYADQRAIVFESLSELEAMDVPPVESSFLAAQTTQDREEFRRVHALLKARVDPHIHVCHTICDATRERQDEAMAIARQVEVMVVVGGYNSGNTRRLVQVAGAQGTPCIHVEQAGELDPLAFAVARRVGLTAGASTPKDLIDAVQTRIENFLTPGA